MTISYKSKIKLINNFIALFWKVVKWIMLGLFGGQEELVVEQEGAEHNPSPAISSDCDDGGEGIEQTYLDNDGLELEYEQMMKKHMGNEEVNSQECKERGASGNMDRSDDYKAENNNDIFVETVEREESTLVDKEGHDFEMPEYNIRRSIATKVIAKKVSRGYVLLDDPCDGCGMPMMELNGQVECKVCPAIMKWIRRQKSRQLCCDVEVRDAQESDEREVEETREDNLVENVFEESLENPSNASISADGVYASSAYIPQNPRIGEADAECEPEGYLEASYDAEYLEEEQNPYSAAMNDGCQSHDFDNQSSNYIASQSVALDEDPHDEKLIEERAKQIIMDARRNQGWSFDSPHSNEQSEVKTRCSNDADDGAMDEIDRSVDAKSFGYQDEKSTNVIHVSREKLSISVSSESKKSCSLHIGSDILEDLQSSFESNNSKSLKKIEMRAESIIMESRKKLQLGNDLGAAVDMILSPRSVVRKKQRNWLAWTKSRMSSWDAAIILQALARRFLARKRYLEIKASIAYQTLVIGRAKDSDHEDKQNLLTDTFCCRSDEDLVTNAPNEVASDSGKVPGNNSSYVCYTDSEIDDRQQKSPSIGLLCFSSNADSDLNENELTRASAKLLGNKSADGCDDLPETEDQHRIRDADTVRSAQNDMADASIRQLEGDGTTYHVNEAKSEEKKDDCELEAQNVIDKHYSRDPPASAIGNCGVKGNEKATEPDKFMELNYRIPPAAHSQDDEDGVNLNDKYFMESPKGTYFDFAEKKQCENIFANHQALNVNKSAELSDREADGRRCPDPTPFPQTRPVATHGGRDDTYQMNPDPPMKKEILRSGTATLKRNVLADVACKFDDAVSKVMKNMTSLVTCTSNANTFDGATEIDRFQSSSGDTASVATISMRHDKFVTTESRRKMASTQIMYRLKSGWRLANASCPGCQMPTMIPPGGHHKVCVACSEAGLERNLSTSSASDGISRDTGDGIVSNVIRSTIPHNTSYEQSRQISGEISRRLNSGWLVVAAVCPACKIPLMKSPVDDLDHCLSCGPMNSRFSTFHLSSNSSSSQEITHCNNALARVGNYNEFGINDCVRHPELTGQPAFVNDYYANQYSHAPNFHDDPNTFVHQTQRGREPPNPHKPLRNCYYNGEPVNGVVMNMREGRDYEMKENSYRVANYAGSMQPASAAALSAIEEAKMRIENAKRHISNSKALRVPPGTGNLNIYHNLGSGSSTFGSSGTFPHHY